MFFNQAQSSTKVSSVIGFIFLFDIFQNTCFSPYIPLLPLKSSMTNKKNSGGFEMVEHDPKSSLSISQIPSFQK